MDLRRLRAGEAILGVSGAVLLVALFLAWYDGRSAWEALGVLDVVLAFVAVNALAVPVVTASYRVPALPLAHQSLTTIVSLCALFLVLARAANIPDWASGRDAGLWLALVAALVMVAGGLAAIRDERRPTRGRHNDLTGVPAPGPPQIETLPAPRPE